MVGMERYHKKSFTSTNEKGEKIVKETLNPNEAVLGSIESGDAWPLSKEMNTREVAEAFSKAVINMSDEDIELLNGQLAEGIAGLKNEQNSAMNSYWNNVMGGIAGVLGSIGVPTGIAAYTAMPGGVIAGTTIGVGFASGAILIALRERAAITEKKEEIQKLIDHVQTLTEMAQEAEKNRQTKSEAEEAA